MAIGERVGRWRVTAITERQNNYYETTMSYYVTDGWAEWIEGQPRVIQTIGYRPFVVGNELKFIDF